MIDSLIKIIKNNLTVLENITYLSLMQLLNMLMPLLTYPYLIRVIGTEYYGKIVFAMAITSYFSVVINFGFNISATKNIASNIGNKDKINEIVSSVYLIKLLLWICSFIVFIVSIYTIPILSENKVLFIFVFGISLNELLFSQWFFQGVEKIKYITLISFVGKILYVTAVLLFIKTKSNFLLLPIINVITVFLTGSSCLYVIFIKEKITFKFQTYETLLFYVKDSFLFFMSTGFVLIKEQTNSIIIGLFLGFQDVAYYDFVSKIVNILKQPFLIIRDAFFPSFIQNKNILKLNNLGLICFVISLLIYFSLIIFSTPMTYLIGKEELIPAIFLFNILGINIVLTVLSVFSGMILIIINKKRKFTLSLVVSTFFYLIFISILVFFNIVTLKTLVYGYGLSLLIEVLIRIYNSSDYIKFKKTVL
jgi:PST family polysaccharide transporter